MFFAIVRTMLRTTECDDITQDDAVFSRRQVIGVQNAALLPTARNGSTQLQHANAGNRPAVQANFNNAKPTPPCADTQTLWAASAKMCKSRIGVPHDS